MRELQRRESEAELRTRARQQSIGLACLAWVVSGGAFALVDLLIRQQVGGQVSLVGLGFSAEDAENLRSIETWVGGGISLAVSFYVGFRTFSDLGPTLRPGASILRPREFDYSAGALNWWWSFYLPMLIATWAFGTLYYWGYAGMLRAAG